MAAVARGIVYHLPGAGRGSNNDAEWLALIHALTVAARLGVLDVQLLGDSATVIGQVRGRSKCRSDLEVHHTAFAILRSRFDRVQVRRIKRTQNLAGIFLAKLHSGR